MPAMDAYEAVVGKRDQRAFLPAAIPEAALLRILQAGRMTGSSKNREPNRFVVVRDRERLAALGALSPVGRWMTRAAAAIVIVQTEEHQFDAGRCAQNMMLAAWGEGIGSCPAHLPEVEVARLLGIPDGLAINRVIGFGHVDPTRAAPPASVARRRRPLAELVHYERWSPGSPDGTRETPASPEAP
jgi:nitroreductase